MRQNVWIWNHYATNMFFDKAGRHYWFAENLMMRGYNPAIFCASINHFSDNHINTKGDTISIDFVNKIPFVFVKTPNYKGNGRSRIINMISFYRNLFPATKQYANKYGKPDIILASSVHPLTLVAGIKIAKIFNIPCICEVRDLWPESLIAYGALKRNSIITRILYQGEKWIYKNADSIIMTWEGGKDYILDQGWEDVIDLSKVNFISNGVDIESFDRNSNEYQLNDPDLNNKNYKNIIYAGSIRKVNNLSIILDTAKIIQDKGIRDIRFLIYGSGNELDFLMKRCKDENINNIIFKGRIGKKYIPFVLQTAYINILHNSSTLLDKYGQSQNKLFEYLAAGNCIVQTYTTGYSILKKYNCGLSVSVQNAHEISKVILQACSDEERAKEMGQKARHVAHEFDFKRLTHKLVNLIENL